MPDSAGRTGGGGGFNKIGFPGINVAGKGSRARNIRV